MGFFWALTPPENGKAVTAPMFDVLSWLWDAVAAPIVDHLGHRDAPEPGAPWPCVWWIPTGALSPLPIHAAGRHQQGDGRGQSVLDLVVSSYTPTARVLWKARQARRLKADSLIVGINAVPGLPRLDQAEAEAQAVCRLMDEPTPPLLGHAAVHDRVTALLPAAGLSHFACHAVADPVDPARSYIALQDKGLTVAAIGKFEFRHAWLAFLSACSTAVTTEDLPDESIHIASAFQLAGYAHVIATLWRLNDYVAPELAEAIYRALNAGREPALAVHDAVRAMRDDPILGSMPQFWAAHVHFGP